MRRKNNVVALMASAMVFGTVAGTAMVGVNTVADKYMNTAVESTAASEDASANAGSSASHMTSDGANSSGNLMLHSKDSSETNSNSASETENASVKDIVKNAMPSVVSITNTIQYKLNGYSMFGFGEDQTAEAAASGSGVIIGKNDTELLVVTNHHVVEDASALSVQFVDGTSVDAEIKGTSSEADLAVIAIPLSSIPEETMQQIKIAEFGDSDELYVGDQVVAIGNALGYGQSVTTGIISAKDREIQTENGSETGLLQTDAAINPGNSGGALLNMQGQLIGINVAKYSSTEVEGMGYSIPSSQVKKIAAELSARTTRSKVDASEQGVIGIQAKTVDAQTAEAYSMPQGVYVYKIIEGSAAENSGLQERDIIVSFDGQTVSSMDDLSSLLTRYKAGETVSMMVQRMTALGDYVEQNLEITLGSKE